MVHHGKSRPVGGRTSKTKVTPELTVAGKKENLSKDSHGATPTSTEQQLEKLVPDLVAEFGAAAIRQYKWSQLRSLLSDRLALSSQALKPHKNLIIKLLTHQLSQSRPHIPTAPQHPTAPQPHNEKLLLERQEYFWEGKRFKTKQFNTGMARLHVLKVVCT
eukprot:GHVT01019590.1.p1 GENE.GHVT01019590.1~~GHVT01019590.1.p1  ORF type:complete len:180 (+),score=13.52 GHVT01019590.1:59-541(+)